MSTKKSSVDTGQHTLVRVNDTKRQWPTPQQERLLRAALASGEQVVKAWQNVQAELDLDTLDLGSQRLLPLLYHNLRAHGVDTPLMGKLKGVHHRAWYANQHLVAAMTPLLQALRAAGIPIMLLTDAARMLHADQDYGLRPLDAFDILVPYDKARDANVVMRAQGWKPKYLSSAALTEQFFAMAQGVRWADPQGRVCHLHWRSMDELYAAATAFWDAALPLEVNGVGVWMMCPTDQLLHLCLRLSNPHPKHGLRSIADAVTLLKAHHDSIDWGRFARLGQQCQISLRLAYALGYLRERMGAPMQDTVINRLVSTPVTRTERLEYWSLQRRPSVFQRLMLEYTAYRRRSSATHTPPSLIGLLRSIQTRRGFSRLFHIPKTMVVRLLRRLGRDRAFVVPSA